MFYYHNHHILKGMRLAAYLATLLILFTPFPVLSAQWPVTGTAQVHDGDTLRINGHSIRIWGIDAAELKQTCTQGGSVVPCGLMAREALERLVKGQTVTCIAKGKSYQRIVAQCYAGGRDIAAAMTRLGMAHDDVRYSRGYYADDEAAAKEVRAGWWAMTFEIPARWRACHLPQRKNSRPASCVL